MLSVVAALTFATNALAVGAPVNVGTPFESGPPSVAVDAAGNAYVAWANTKDLPPTTVNVVQYCVLPVDAVGCVHSGTLTPADGAAYIDDVQVLVDGSTVVLLADVYGAKGPQAEEYEPEQEWTSTDGGATFTAIDGGKSVANGIIDADTQPLGAVVLPGTNALGFAWNTAGGSPPTFDEFPLTSPPLADKAFAKLEPDTNPDQISNAGGQFASQFGSSPGVLGIFNTDFTNGPLGCSQPSGDTPFGTAFVYGSGSQDKSNSYDISPGSPGSAWKVPVTQADCNVAYPAVGGGPSGFGVIEDNETTGSTIYHRFDQATTSFDTPEVTISTQGEQQAALSQDDEGGVYATFLSGGVGGPLSLAYSYDGGTTWSGPGILDSNADGGASNLTSTVSSLGQGWAVWADNGSVFAQSFDAADAVAPPAADTVITSQTAGTSTGVSIAIPAGTVGETDRATITGANAGTATGTVSYGLYSAPSCVASSEVFNGGAVAVSAGVAAPSNAVTSALAPGTYYWQAVYSGNAGNLFGAGGNVANVSACGSEVLTVGSPTVLPISNYTIKSITANSNGTVTIVFVPTQSGEAELVVTVPTASIADSSAVAAKVKKSKKCKKGQIKVKGKCVASKTVAGKASAHGTAGVPLKLTVKLSSRIKALLKKGKTVHLTATLTYKSSLGGAATVKNYPVTVKGHKPKKKK